MKYIIIAILLFAATALADPLCVDPNGNPLQTFGPDGSRSVAVTTLIRSGVDLTGSSLYALYCATASFMRLMPASTSTKGDYAMSIIPAATWTVRAVNPKTPYMNYSGACYLQRQ